jgi:hypothetical protein
MVQTLEKTEKDKNNNNKQNEAPKTVKSSRKRPDVGEKDDFAEFIENTEADTSSEDTVFDFDKIEAQGKKNKKQVKFVEDDDRSSVSSFEPHTRYVAPALDLLVSTYTIDTSH